ncbi:MAG: succinylglutamate desuccinylase/aspartoacylase family protein [Actinomycetales bacterium]|nr:succinylglutamate desuccinylase/aspartoacylase family protein [Actinomycetales bacterium]
MARDSLPIGSVRVRAGTAAEVGLLITRLVTGGDVTLPVRVVHGRLDGPVVWLDAAVHGDEVVGVEVIRQVLRTLQPKRLRGTVIAVPIVNVLGFMTGDRYLPDRRDLNRSFPGSARGSLAARVAHLFMTEVVSKCSVGIDMHTGADRRANLPQIRADLDDPGTLELARAFGAPVILHARLRDGSIRHAAAESGARVLLYEGGENLRLDEYAVDAGVRGVRRVLAALGMTDPVVEDVPPTLECRGSGWVRSRRTGIAHLDVELGQHVVVGERLGSVFDSYGKTLRTVRADRDGVVIGRANAPIVNPGDALVHIASPIAAAAAEPG